MTMETATPQIDCPIGLFGEVEHAVATLTADINRAADIGDKAQLAGDLRAALAPLLDCTSYDRSNTNCRLCREVSGLRDKTAALVQQTARLAR